MNLRNKLTQLFCVAFVFAAILFFGCKIYADYGIPSDEEIERVNGIVSLNYVGKLFRIQSIQKSESLVAYSHLNLASYKDRDYPVLFNMPAAMLERFFHINDERAVYLFRHLLVFLISVLGLYAIYSLGRLRFSSWRMGLVPVAFFLLSPRLFAESFYNSKDLVFLAFFCIATFSLFKLILQPSYRWAFLHAIATALAINVRIMGVLMVFITLACILLKLYQEHGKDIRRYLGITFVYVLIMVFLTVALWPWLWGNPVGHLIEGFKNMSLFSRGPEDVFFMGAVHQTRLLPWYYIPAYILLTVPLFITALFSLGTLKTAASMFRGGRHFLSARDNLQDLIYLALIFIPIAAVIILNSVLYDGWRQLYFIYPAMLILATKGLVDLLNFRVMRNYLVARFFVLMLGVYSLISTGYWMYVVHPFQNVYFNILAGQDWIKNFEVDYWGLSNRQALEYLANIDADDQIYVMSETVPPLDLALKSLPENDRNRIIVVNSLDKTKYVINNYRFNFRDYEAHGRYKKLLDIKADGEVINSIYVKKIN